MSTNGDSVIRRFEDHGDRYPGLLYVLVEWPEGGWDAKPVPEAFDSLFPANMPFRDILHRSIEEGRKTDPGPLPIPYNFQEPDTLISWSHMGVEHRIASRAWLKRTRGKSWDRVDCMDRFDVLAFNACQEFADDPTLTDQVAGLGTTKAWLRTIHRLANPRRKWWEWLGSTSNTIPASGDITRPVFSVIPDVFDVSARIARHLIEQRSGEATGNGEGETVWTLAGLPELDDDRYEWVTEEEAREFSGHVIGHIRNSRAKTMSKERNSDQSAGINAMGWGWRKETATDTTPKYLKSSLTKKNS